MSSTEVQMNARRTESLDAVTIEKLVTKATISQFGQTNILSLIEKAILAVTLSNDEDEIVAHGAFYDYPRVKNVKAKTWEAWFQHHYALPEVTPLNTLFLHHFVARKNSEAESIYRILHTVFNAAPNVHHVIVNTAKGVYPEQALMDNFSACKVVVNEDQLTHNCYISKRHNYFPLLHIRLATMEDNDDLTPIFEEQNETLKKTYGDFFIAELVQSSNDQMRCLAAEVSGKAIGFMSVCSEINVDLLNRCYELGPYHGLRKPHPDDILQPPKDDLDDELKRGQEDEPIPDETVHVGTSHVTESLQQPVGAEGVELMSEDTEEHGDVSEFREENNSHSTRSPRSPEDANEMKFSSRTGSSRTDGHSEGQDSRSSESPFVMPPPNTAAFGRVYGKHGKELVGESNFFEPKYFGEGNAVVIQLYAMDEAYEMRSLDFMTKVFRYFPDVDYAIITIPRLVPVFPLLQNFTRVPSRPTCTLPHELYVFHRAGLIQNFKVRTAQYDDYDALSSLFNTLHLSEEQLKDFTLQQEMRRDEDGTQMQCYVATCTDKIVGFAVIRQEEDIEYIRSHYNIEDFIYFDHYRRNEHGHLYHFVLSPAFHHMTKIFLKEIMRLDEKSSIYYPLYPDVIQNPMDESGKCHGLVNCLGEMVPVRARRQIVYPLEKLGENAPSKRVLQKRQRHYQLNHINRKLINEPKAIINAKIVVVGASTTGLAFLESLIFCPHLQFTNLILVSPHGPPSDIPRDKLCDQMLSTNHCYNEEHYDQVNWRRVVNVVYGKMTAIQRKKKHIVVNDYFVVPYDHLIIATGLQYQIPCPTGANIEKLLTNKEIPNSPDRLFKGTHPPKNLFVINDAYEANIALHWLEKHWLTNTRVSQPILIYGHTIDAYSCLQTLMDLGVTGSRVILVKPPQESEVTCFNNPSLEEMVNRNLQIAGVQVYSGYLLAQWNSGEEEPKRIHSASFTSDAKPISLGCSAFFSFYKKRVDQLAFKAINDACLVFDARLVIDGHFHTNDPCIRSAGPLTKYQRVFYADHWTHSRYNSRVVGEELARTILRLFDPTLEALTSPPQERVKLVPAFDGPKIVGCVLPGGFHYLHMGKPMLDTPLVNLMSQKDYGKVFISGAPGEDKPYFRLHINGYNAVESITCISKEPLPVNNLIWLYGLHEQLLNNFEIRYKEGQIKDLYEYFSGIWSVALFHDRFPDFRDEIRELLQSKGNGSQQSLEEVVRRMLDEDLGLTPNQRQELRQVYADSGAKRAVETRLLSFISYNYYHLSMYAKPDMI